MTIVVATAEAGSLSAASRRLGVPLPTVSRKIAELEAHLNAQLLIRSTRKLTLTDAGRAYVAASKRILEQVNEAERAASEEFASPRGDLIVTAPVVFGRLHVLPAIADFLATFAAIDVRLLLTDRNLHLIDDQIDVAVRIGALPDSSLIATNVGAVRYVVCASPAYLTAHRAPKSPEDLSALSCVTFDTLTSATSWKFTAQGETGGERTIPIHSRLSVNSAEAAIEAAVAGVGVTRVLSYQVAEAVAAGKLQIILQEFEPEALPVSLIYAARDLPPRKLPAFVNFAAPYIRRRLSGAAASAG